ncbi:MAG: UbiH/UbiF/VisC/COQ6 family ubiquinone biosynthesis hydroxylase [Proteobacteria bacterium]|nr:UbiH/UbiF/VisC/COQ6 family ubiquinone biosynthesis hydroxylase [Pseudomonadota bacterium]
MKTDAADFDIVIVGGGMVGASMACLLGSLDLRIALIDRTQYDSTQLPFAQDSLKFDARVSALTPASQKIFSEIGAWEAINAMRCCPYQDIEVWDADGTGRIHFSAAEINQQSLGTIVENSIINTALYAALEKVSNLKLMAPATIKDLSVNNASTILETEEGQQFAAGLVIAADGANSRIRELAGFKTREWDYNHLALVTTVRTELPHKQTALQRFIDTGPLAFLPLASKREDDDQDYCSIVWSDVPDRAQQLLEMPDDQFRHELATNIENKLGTIEWVDKRYSFPLRQRHALDYVQDNIVLIGDAAHTIHPLAGQGVNLGLLDAAALAAELVRGLEAGRSPADPTVLGRYQRKRIGHNLGMMWLMEGFKHLFAEQALPVRWLRNVGMSGVDNISMIKNHLARKAMGLDLPRNN